MCRKLDASRLHLSHSSCSVRVKLRTALCTVVSLEGNHAYLPQVQLVANSSKRLQLLCWHSEVGLDMTSAVESSLKGFMLTHGHEVSPGPPSPAIRHVMCRACARPMWPAGAQVSRHMPDDLG